MIRKLIFALCLLVVACVPIPAISSTPTSSGADAKLERAIRQARDTLGTFTDKIAAPHPNRTFVALKVRFTPPGEPSQDIWVDEVTYVDGTFRGNIGDDIPSLKLQAGEQITVQEEDIVDWMIVEEGTLIGGYTIRLALERMSPEERERFLETLDYTIYTIEE